MLKGMDKILTGDLLKILCDMGHGDELVIADTNFPADAIAQRLIRYPGIDGERFLNAIAPLFPLDPYVDNPTGVMELTDGDKASGMPDPEVWALYADVLRKNDENFTELGRIERQEFYERARKAYAVIQTGEERLYGNLLLRKGVVK